MNTTGIVEDDQSMDFLIELLRRIDHLVVEIDRISARIRWGDAPREIAAAFLPDEGFREVMDLRLKLFEHLAERIGEDQLLDLFE